MPEAYHDGVLRFASAARAVIDAVRQMREIGDIRQIMGSAVQLGRARVPQLALELDRGPRAGTALIRQVLAEIADGIRSAAEGDLRTLIRRAKLPDPLYNPRLYAGPRNEDFIGCPDAWWPSAGVALQVDSRAWHLSPADWSKSMDRHTLMSTHGIVILHYTPAKLRSEPKAVVAQIRLALAQGRELPGIRTVPVAGRILSAKGSS